MRTYTHKVQYYETDKMGITHHSNYIRWMEEARVDYLEQLGWGYAKLEEAGVISPVTAIDCKYRASTRFMDEIEIFVSVEAFKGVKLLLKYEMTKRSDHTIICIGHSEHCFLDGNGSIVRIKKEYPEFYQALMDLVNQNM